MTRPMCRQYRRNLRIGSIVCLWAYAGVAFAQTLSQVTSFAIPGFGVPVTVLLMSAAGSLVGFAYTDPLESRRKLYILTLANTLIAAWCVVLIPEWRGWEVSHAAQPPLGGVIAALNCVIVPALFKRLPTVVAAWMDRYLSHAQPPKGNDP